MNAAKNVSSSVSKAKVNIPSEIIVVVLLLVVVVSVTVLMSYFASPLAMDASTEIQEGQVIDLANLPHNMILPNGAELKNVEISTLSGVEIISAEYISSEAYPPIKLTWLDSNGKGVAYSSHTVLNKPLYYGFHDGDSGVIGIWPHLGAEKVRVEVWKE